MKQTYFGGKCPEVGRDLRQEEQSGGCPNHTREKWGPYVGREMREWVRSEKEQNGQLIVDEGE